jgi:N-glycosylase/DNA lyase
MLFGLRDTGAFPIDTWVRHIMNDMYGFEEKDIKGMSEFACGRFGGYAGYAQQYLFYYYRDSGR